MRFLGGEAPGSRVLGSRTLHVALMALFGVLISAFVLYATVAWAQTAEEAGGTEAAQSESSSGGGASILKVETDTDEGSGDVNEQEQPAGEDEIGVPEEDATEDGSAEDNVVKTPEEAAEDEAAEGESEADPVGPLADDEIEGEIALGRDRDEDNEAELITIPRGDCEVRQGAIIVLQGENGETYRLRDGDTVQISSDGDEIRIVSNRRSNNDIIDSERDPVEEGVYEVTSSTGINCDDVNEPPDGDDGNDNTCVNIRDTETNRVAVVRGNEPVTGTIDTGVADPDADGFVNFRAVYRTSTPGGVLRIRVFSEDDVAIDRTIFGARSGVITSEIRLNSSYTYEITPARQGFTVQFQGGPGFGNEECVQPSNLPAPPGVAVVVVDNVIERTVPLPDTGEGEPPTTSATGERASTPASVLFSILSIVGFTGLLFFRRLAMK